MVFAPGTDLHDDSLVQSGALILQDKASCFPAHALSVPKHSIVIDACAAPGNKTSHLSSLMQNTGKIFAFELDKNRLQTLIRLTQLAGCTSRISTFLSFFFFYVCCPLSLLP